MSMSTPTFLQPSPQQPQSSATTTVMSYAAAAPETSAAFPRAGGAPAASSSSSPPGGGGQQFHHNGGAPPFQIHAATPPGGGGSAGPRPRMTFYHPDDHNHLTELICLVRKQIEVFVEPPKKSSDDDAVDAAAAPYDDGGGLYAEGKVGIRCVHCAPSPSDVENGAACATGRAKPGPKKGSTRGGRGGRGASGGGGGKSRLRGAVAYPTSTRLVYQSVRNWQRHHMLNCPAMPSEIKEEFATLKAATWQRRSSNDSSAYWERSCVRLGMVDTVPPPNAAGGEAQAQAQNHGRSVPGGLRLRQAALDGTWTDEMGLRAWSALRGDDGKRTSALGRATFRGPGMLAQAAALPVPMLSPSPSASASTLSLGAAVLESNGASSAYGGGSSSILAGSIQSSSIPLFQHQPQAGLRVPGTGHCFPNTFATAAAAAGSPTIIGSVSVAASSICTDRPQKRKDQDDRMAAQPSAAIMMTMSTPSPAISHQSSFSGASPPLSSLDAFSAASASTGASPTFQSGLPNADGSAQNNAGSSAATMGFSDASSAASPHDAAGPSPAVQQQVKALAALRLREQGTLNGALPVPSISRGAAPGRASRQAISGGATAPPAAATAFLASRSAEQPQPSSGGSSPFALGHPPAPASTSPSAAADAALLDLVRKVRVARAVVRHAAAANGGIVVASVTEGSHHRRLLLADAGLRLYELFAGARPADLLLEARGAAAATASATDGADNSDWQQPGQQPTQKRGKRPPGAPEGGNGPSGRRYVPLRELGLPVSICRLVSALLDGDGDGTGGEGNGDGDGVGADRKAAEAAAVGYKSVDEIDEDLRLLEERPDKFLVDATSDAGAGFRVPENALYGRTEEMALLVKAFDMATNPSAATSSSTTTNTAALIFGSSGTGKSSLVRALRGHVEARGASFVSAKFDDMRQGTRMVQPLSGIVSALDEYCALLARDEIRRTQVRKNLESASVADEIGVLTSLIPNLAGVLGPPKDAASLTQVTGRNSMQRLVFLFRMLLRAASGVDHPLVLFLDDLQWADEVSLELMHALATDSEIRGMLFAGSYRDDEVSSNPAHPLAPRLRALQAAGNVTVVPIRVTNLGRRAVNAFLSDVLRTLPRWTEPLSDAVHSKTDGRALFVVQFLSSLCDEGLVRFSLSSRRWEWDLESIRVKDVAENVVPFMTAKFLRLPREVNAALRVAASFGIEAPLTLIRIIDRDPERFVNVEEALEVAAREGIVVKTGGATEGVAASKQPSSSSSSSSTSTSAFQFSHDQIQRAAYVLIPEPERPAYHLQIGRRLWRNSSAEEMEEHLFAVATQMHRGAQLIADVDEKINLVELTLAAGQKASAMSAFGPAMEYLRAGVHLIEEADWTENRELCLDLYNLCAEVECVMGKFEDVKVHLEEVLRRGRTLREKLGAYYTLIQSSGSAGNTADALDTACTVLGHLGEPIPSSVTRSEVGAAVAKTQGLLLNKSESEVLGLKTITDENKREAMRFLNLIMLYAYTSGRKTHFALFSCKMVQISLLHGMCRESALAFSCYGMLICGLAGDTAGGYRFGKLGVSLLERFSARESLARVFLTVYGFINSWIEPMQSSFPPLKRAVDVGLSTGDTEFAMVNAHLYLSKALMAGRPLGALVDEMRTYSRQMVEFNQNLACLLNTPCRQAAHNLMGRSADPLKLIGEEMNENTLLRNADEGGNAVHLVYFYRMFLEVLFGEYERAAETAEKNCDIEKHFMARFDIVCNHSFYSGLAALTLARRERTVKLLGIIEKTTAQMKVWAASAAWNCQHKLELMIAEYAFLEGDVTEAASAYDRAVATAGKHGFVHEQALALERAGVFYLENGSHATATQFFTKAHDCYLRWEAYSKASHVKERYLRN